MSFGLWFVSGYIFESFKCNDSALCRSGCAPHGVQFLIDSTLRSQGSSPSTLESNVPSSNGARRAAMRA